MARRRALLIAAPDRSLETEELGTVLGDPGIGGFDVTLLPGRPPSAISPAIGQFYADCGPDDLALLYVGGPGLRDRPLPRHVPDGRAGQTVLILDGAEPGTGPVVGFARHLVTGLRDGSADLDGDGAITLDELQRYVADRLQAEAMGTVGTVGVTGADGLIGPIDGRRQTVIASNPAWALPVYLRQAIGSRLTPERLAAITSLDHLRRSADPRLGAGVRQAYRTLADDRSRAVSVIAAARLVRDDPAAGAVTAHPPAAVRLAVRAAPMARDSAYAPADGPFSFTPQGISPSARIPRQPPVRVAAALEPLTTAARAVDTALRPVLLRVMNSGRTHTALWISRAGQAHPRTPPAWSLRPTPATVAAAGTLLLSLSVLIGGPATTPRPLRPALVVAGAPDDLVLRLGLLPRPGSDHPDSVAAAGIAVAIADLNAAGGVLGLPVPELLHQGSTFAGAPEALPHRADLLLGLGPDGRIRMVDGSAESPGAPGIPLSGQAEAPEFIAERDLRRRLRSRDLGASGLSAAGPGAAGPGAAGPGAAGQGAADLSAADLRAAARAYNGTVMVARAAEAAHSTNAAAVLAALPLP